MAASIAGFFLRRLSHLAERHEKQVRAPALSQRTFKMKQGLGECYRVGSKMRARVIQHRSSKKIRIL